MECEFANMMVHFGLLVSLMHLKPQNSLYFAMIYQTDYTVRVKFTYILFHHYKSFSDKKTNHTQRMRYICAIRHLTA